MKSISTNRNLKTLLWVASTMTAVFVLAPRLLAVQQSAANTARVSVAGGAMPFAPPQQAADELVAAAEKFDERILDQIFGQGGEDVVFSGEYPQDRQRASDFAAEAHEKKSISVDHQKGNRAFLHVGKGDCPFPLPIVKHEIPRLFFA